MKMDAFKTAKKVNKYLGYFCKKICHQELSKIANLVTLLMMIGYSMQLKD